MNTAISAMLTITGQILDDGSIAESVLEGTITSVCGIQSLQMGVFGGIIVGLGVAALHNLSLIHIFTVAPGDTVSLLQVVLKNGMRWILCRNADGAEGWFADPDSAVWEESSDGMHWGYFDEAH